MRNFPDMPAQIKLTQRRGTTLINLAVAALIIAALYVGREIFVQVAPAVFLVLYWLLLSSGCNRGGLNDSWNLGLAPSKSGWEA
jgi:hypothetical protein